MWQLRAGILAASLIISSAATSEELKLTVLYKQPQNAEEFRQILFRQTHADGVCAQGSKEDGGRQTATGAQWVTSSLLYCHGVVVRQSGSFQGDGRHSRVEGHR